MLELLKNIVLDNIHFFYSVFFRKSAHLARLVRADSVGGLSELAKTNCVVCSLQVDPIWASQLSVNLGLEGVS